MTETKIIRMGYGKKGLKLTVPALAMLCRG